MFEVIASTGMILSPEFTSALHGLFVSLFQVVVLGLMTLLGLGLKLWIGNMKNGIQKMIATRLVSYAEQKFVDNAERQKFVAEALSKKFPRLAADEIALLLEEGVVALKKARGALVILALVLGLAGGMLPAYADTASTVQIVDTLKAVPQAKQGLMWAPGSQEVAYIATWQLLEYQKFAVEGGYLGAGGLIGVLSYDVGGLKDLGVKMPILELVEFNIGYGLGQQFIGIKNVGIAGWTVTLIRAKF
jgi:hypothetical protein